MDTIVYEILNLVLYSHEKDVEMVLMEKLQIRGPSLERQVWVRNEEEVRQVMKFGVLGS
ncbi:MAG: hypothetical protein IPK55_10355 [Streptococcus sp.]|nr:hypothetical protein [Streptococcus sp.]